nr:galactitol-1-phosphate 5-dehydrogenase [Evansella tamaricis]
MKEGEVLLKVMAVGVCGSDIPRANVKGAHVMPIILGHEFSGVITDVGSKITKFKVGDRVTVPPLIPCFECQWCDLGEYSLCEDYDYYGSRRDGAMAEYLTVKEENLLKVPDSISYEDAATTDPCANALHAMTRAEFKAGDSVCIYGAGPIGLFAVLYAKICGASKIVAVDVWDKKLELARKVGADFVINSRETNPVEKVKEFTGGQGTDIVIDFSGVPSAQLDCIRSTAKLGKVILLGISHKELPLTKEDVDLIMRNQLDIRGSWNSFTKPFPGNDWTESIQLFDKHGMTAKNIISHRLKLEEVPDIFENIAKGNYFFSKIMIYPQGKIPQ